MDTEQARQIVNETLDIFSASAQYDALHSVTPVTHVAPEPIWTVLQEIDSLQLKVLGLLDVEAFTSQDSGHMLRYFLSVNGNLADNIGHKMNVAKHIVSLSMSLLEWVIRDKIKVNDNAMGIGYQEAMLRYFNPVIVRDYKLAHVAGSD